MVDGAFTQTSLTVNVAEAEHTEICCVTIVTQPFGNVAESVTVYKPPVVNACVGLGTVVAGLPSPKSHDKRLPGGVVLVKITGVPVCKGEAGENVKLGKGAGITCITKILFVAADGDPSSIAVTAIV